MVIWIELLQIRDGGRTPYWKSFFSDMAHLREIWRVDAESYEDTGHMTKAAISKIKKKIQDGGRLTFW